MHRIGTAQRAHFAAGKKARAKRLLPQAIARSHKNSLKRRGCAAYKQFPPARKVRVKNGIRTGTDMHSRSIILYILSLGFSISCCSEAPTPSSDGAQQAVKTEETAETPDEPRNDKDSETSPESEAKEETKSDKAEKNTAYPDDFCFAAGEFKKGRCVCGDSSILQREAANWVCIHKRLHCMYPYKGCQYNGNPYPAYSTIRKNAVMCGHAGALKDLKGYGCDPEYGEFRSDIHGAWRCDSATCSCHDETIHKGTYCTARGILCHNNCPEGYLTGSALKEGVYSCDGVKLTDEAGVSHEGIVCLNKKWTCEHGYVCENNHWKCVADPTSYADNPVCDGITVKTIADAKSARDYTCRYGRWICENPDGCSCITGAKHTHKIALGEQCVNTSCEEAPKQQYLGDKFSKDRFEYKYGEENWTWLENGSSNGVCFEGNCKCGSGHTPQFGKCVKGESICGNLRGNQYGEFYCALYYHRNEGSYIDYRGNLDVLNGKKDAPEGRELPFVSEFRSGEVGGLLICGKKEGCMTPDGRHYSRGAVIGHHGWNDPYLTTAGLSSLYNTLKDLNENLQYHVHGDVDTTKESVSVLGDCVIDVPEEQCASFISKKAKMPVCYPKREDGRPGYIGRPGDLPVEGSDTRCTYAQKDAAFGLVAAYPQGLGNTGFERTASTSVYDVYKCEGGKRWCHGKNNDPILVPENPEGYECREVSQIPDNKAKKGLKSWVCVNPSGCECGGQTCEINHACMDGQCMDGMAESVEMCDGEPLMLGYRCARNWLGYSANGYIEFGQVCTEERCSCGDMICPEGATCSHGQCLCGQDIKPGGNYRCEAGYWRSCQDNESNPPKPGGWYCDILAGCDCNGKHIEKNEKCSTACYGGSIQKDGCYCGDSRIEADANAEYACALINDKPTIVCASPRGCPCGIETCPASTACVNDKCIDPLQGEVIESKSDATTLTPPLACRAVNGCSCGEKTCKKGDFCLNNTCTENIWAAIIHNHRVFYDFINIQHAIEDPRYAKPETFFAFSDAYLPKNWSIDPQNPNFDQIAWHEILLKGYDSSMPEEYAVTPYFKRYYCGFNEIVFKADKSRCALEEGCTCGKTKCPRGAECANSKCLFDEVYNESMCGGRPQIKADLLRSTSVDKAGNCVCSGITLNPALTNSADVSIHDNRRNAISDLYLCTDFGWICRNAKGCPCGEESCHLGAICGANGRCSSVIGTCLNDGEGGCLLSSE